MHLSYCFVPLEEGAIAKGIRRIIGVTGTAALLAQELGSQLEAHVADLQARLHELQQKKSVDVEGLDALVTQLRYFILIYLTSKCTFGNFTHNLLSNSYPSRKDVDAAVVSSVLKTRLRDSLESLQKSIYAIKSEALMQKVEAEALLLREVNSQPFFLVFCARF